MNTETDWQARAEAAESELARVQAQAAAQRHVLEVLDGLGGLGLDKHQWIRDVLNKTAATPRIIPAEKLAPLIRGLKAAHASLHAQESDSLYHVAVAEVDKALAAAKALMEDAR